MKVGDLVRTKQAHSTYGYDRPVCIVIGAKSRLDGTYLKVIDSKGKVIQLIKHDESVQTMVQAVRDVLARE